MVINSKTIRLRHIMRFELFWDFTQRRIVASNRRFETAYPFHLQGNDKFGAFVVAHASEKIFFFSQRNHKVG